MTNAYNEMRHDCARQGCFNKVRRPKIEVFAECFQKYNKKIAMSDIDGVVEINGHFLFLEWKTNDNLSTGQRITFQRLTRSNEKIIVFVVHGDAETMETYEYQSIWNGLLSDWQTCTLDDLKREFCSFEDWARGRLAA